MLAVTILGVLASAAVGGNWERFRGPNGSGTVDDKDVPLTFGVKENVVWTIALPGVGNSSPVIWGKHLFVQAAAKDGKERMLICADTAAGKIVWQKTIPGVFVKIRGDSSLASSTPTTDGAAVYVSFWDGKDIIVAAYSMTGEALWSKNLGPFFSQHGAGASPILYKDKLILANDMDGYTESKYKKVKTPVPVAHPSLLVALNKKTGEMVWETPREAERACYSPPCFLEKKGQAEPDLVVVSTTAVTGYSPADGTKKWEAKDWQGKHVRMPLRTIASAALTDGVLVACSGDGAGDRFAAGITLPVNGSDTPKSLWRTKDFPYVPCPLARGDHFYFITDNGYAGCYEARTGKRLWRERLAEDTNFYASPLLIDGKIYAVSETGDVYIFAAEPTYRLLARNVLGDRIRATPAVADGRLYFRGDKNLICVGKSVGPR
jgi:outer membrane protein assembly factor BamB